MSMFKVLWHLEMGGEDQTTPLWVVVTFEQVVHIEMGQRWGGGGGVEVILTIIKVVLSVPIMKFNLELNVVYVTVRTINSVIHRHAISIKVNEINMFRIVVSMAWLV